MQLLDVHLTIDQSCDWCSNIGTHIHSLGRGVAGSNLKAKLNDFCLRRK